MYRFVTKHKANNYVWGYCSLNNLIKVLTKSNLKETLDLQE